jgi:hypothetical protein
MTQILPHYDPTFEIVRVCVRGTVDDQHIGQCFAVTEQFLTKVDCNRVLVDWRESVLVLSNAARPWRVHTLAAMAGTQRRVALLYAAVGERQRKLRDDLQALGANVGVFASEWQALDWLREGLERRVALA